MPVDSSVNVHIWFAFYSMLFSFQCMFCLGTLLGELFLWTCSQKLVVWNLAWEPVARGPCLGTLLMIMNLGLGALLGNLFLGTLLGNFGNADLGCSDVLRNLYSPMAEDPKLTLLEKKLNIVNYIWSTLTSSGNHNSNTNCPPRRTLTKTAKVCKKITSEGFGERMVIVFGI